MFCVRLNLNQLLSPPEVWRLFTHVFILSGLRYWEFLVGSRWWGLADSKRQSFSLAASWFHCDSVAATQTNTLSSSTAFKVQTLLSHWASASCSLKIWTWLEKKGGGKKRKYFQPESLCFVFLVSLVWEWKMWWQSVILTYDSHSFGSQQVKKEKEVG